MVSLKISKRSSGNVLGALYLHLPMGMKDWKMGNDYYKRPS